MKDCKTKIKVKENSGYVRKKKQGVSVFAQTETLSFE
tara:strand:- start:938 stop:1048 length:111 start_codon:yes stop_codon:yes gene_type:complete